MKFEESFDFDHGVDTVARMFGDRDYYVAKYERLGGRSPEIVACDRAGDRFSITVRHALEAATMSLPDLLKKRIGNQLVLEQTDVWQLDAGHGRIAIDIEKTPVAIAIDLRLRDNRGTARLDLRFDIDAEVPLLGSKIEKAVAEPITRRVRDDLEVSRAMAGAYAEPAV